MANAIVSRVPIHQLPPSPPRSPLKTDDSHDLPTGPFGVPVGEVDMYEEPYDTNTPSRTLSSSSRSYPSIEGAHQSGSTPSQETPATAIETPGETGDSVLGSSTDAQGWKDEAVKLENFELIRVIGSGHAGKVLIVKHSHTRSVLAMKAISKRSVLTHNELAHTMAEMSILRRIAMSDPDNPFITKLYTTFSDKENFYFVMKFYPGGDLATQMEIHGILGHMRTRFYAADIIEGLEDLHRQGIIVRDLKPENILLNASGHCVLADFGLSKEFAFRGEPRPISLPQYAGQETPREWAGQGICSMRRTLSGTQKLVIDRANSFVGTAEYLSPEVVKRNDYSYAVDWWALGCIIVEGLTGRVPFRGPTDEEPIELWNRIVYDDWTEVFDMLRTSRTPWEMGFDDNTRDFVGGLLTKDPLYRLTEPFVKRHSYLQDIDWEAVRKGAYADPHNLELHPVSEYNTQYWPQLCLEDEVTVDMTRHESVQSGLKQGDAGFEYDSSVARTPINDNTSYLLSQAEYKAELRDFTWTNDEFYDLDTQRTDLIHGPEPSAQSDLEASEPDTSEPMMLDDPEVVEATTEEDHILPTLPAEAVLPEVEVEVETTGNRDPVGIQDGQTEKPDPPLEFDNVISRLEELWHINHPGHNATTSSDVKPAAPSAFADFNRPPSLVTYPHMSPYPTPIEPPTSDLPPVLRPQRSPTSPVKSVLVDVSKPAKEDATSNIVNRIKEKPPQHIDLPTGLPSSGLSVSDFVAVSRTDGPASPGSINSGGSRFLRRHRVLPSVDDAGIGSRLSVDLSHDGGGRRLVSLLGDEDWEELDHTSSDKSYPNGQTQSPPGYSGFFGRVLKRRPSTHMTSGLRRQTRASDSSRSSDTAGQGSPTKTKPSAGIGLFGSKNPAIGGSKKSLSEKIKSIPKLRKPSEAKDPSPILDKGEVENQKISPRDRPPTARRHTETGLGWLEKKTPKAKHDGGYKPSRAHNDIKSSFKYGSMSVIPRMDGEASEGSTMRRSASENPALRNGKGARTVPSTPNPLANGEPPRVELNETPPIVWDLDRTAK